MTRKEQAEDLRRKVDTIGQVGKPGEQIQNVISVGMLSKDGMLRLSRISWDYGRLQASYYANKWSAEA